MIYSLDVENRNDAELQVARAIEARQPSWHIIHSRWFAHAAPRRTCEGEGDIVVVVPDYGFFVLEVKGAPQLKIEHGRWSRFDPLERGWLGYTKPPWQQAAGVMHYFKKRLQERLGSSIGAYGFAVAFPNCRMSLRFQADAELDRSLILDEDYLHLTIDSQMLGSVDTHILDLLDSQVGRRQRGCDTNAILRVLLPNGRPLAPDHRVATVRARERFAQLTQHQIGAANGALGNKLVLIRGGPGSGKSVVARHIATKVAQGGRRCLLLCFNRLLRDDTKLFLEGTGVDVRTVHELCNDVVGGNAGSLEGKTRSTFGNDEEWLDYCSTLGMLQAISAGLVEPFDTLIVDEFQDLSDAQADMVRFLPAERTVLLCDPNQNLFGDAGAGRTVPQGFWAYDLPENIRNCREVAESVRAMCPANAQHENLTASPVMHRWPVSMSFRDESGLLELLAGAFDDWRSWGFEPSRIALLCATKDATERCIHALRRLNRPFTDDLRKWRENRGCFLGTIRSFKGLDADGVVLVDPPALGGMALSGADAYVATSRACLDFRVIHREDVSVKWLDDAVEQAMAKGG
jgi:hypothetical protein